MCWAGNSERDYELHEGPLAEGEEDSGDSTSGAEEMEAAPVLAEALRVDIPRASLRYLLIHHLQLNYRYTKKKTIFGPGEAAPSHSEVHDRDGLSVEDAGRDLGRGRGLPSPWGLRARVEPDNAAHLGGADNAAAEPE